MYEKIINNIKLNLGENKDLNRKYLASQIENYKDHPYNLEITKEISRMMWDCLSDEEKREFIEISENETPVIDILEEIYPMIEMGKYDNALDKLNGFMKTFQPMFEDDAVNEYHFFTNQLEEEIFNEYIGAKKEMRYIPNNHPLLDLYYVYGFLLLEKHELKEAELYLKKALKINPVSSRILLELSDIYKTKAPNFNKFYMYTIQALEYAYYPQDLARCYRNLGQFYMEEMNFEMAAALYNYSMKYELNPIVYSKLQYIKSKGTNIELELEECLNTLKDKKIQIDVNPFILKTLEELSDKYDEKQALHQALYFYELQYDLNHEQDILEKINNIKRVMNH
ncbi:tetratricopeptide repeat protein [Methanobrevibacter gottschalkii]|uniref:hypothetical protein n=1 Tax=Methanobrevibacter gottschalkii TaxID=190974 RepID=UPI0038CFC932